MNLSTKLLALCRDLRWPVLIGLLLGIAGLQWLQLQQPPAPPVFSYSSAVQRASPAVVNIYTTHQIERSRHPLLSHPLLAPLLQERMRSEQRQQTRLGSGVIVDPRGLVLTNYHVIRQANNIRVALQDGREVGANIIGVDPESDLALLHIALQPLPVIHIPEQSQASIGDVVLAIGNPFGVGQTVTQGIVSATGRSELGLTTFEDFIQTDAAINPGNSGGALVNARGELIGINTAIFSGTGGSQGIGFAIPVQLAQLIMHDLLQHGRVIRGYLGVEMHQLGRKEAEFFNLEHTNGLIITGVHRNSPAEAAGILPGDVILSINGRPIQRAVEALKQVAQMQPGESIALGIYRQGKLLELNAQVTERPLDLTSAS